MLTETLWPALSAVLVVTVLVLAWEVHRLRRRERKLISREARIEAQQSVSEERAALAEARVRQAFEEGKRQGLAAREQDGKTVADDAYRQGYEKGLAEGELNAERHFRVECWTEIKKNQGYFFTSAEVVACYQLMYKNIPLGSPQRYAVDQSEAVDKAALDEMFHKVLGNNPAMTAARQNFGRLELVSRADEKKTASSEKG